MIIRIGSGLSVGKCTGILLQYRTLARQYRLGNKQILRLRQPDVRRNPVSGKQTHLVANHKLLGGDFRPAAIAEHLHRGGDHPGQMIRYALGTQFLDKPHYAAEQQHAQDNNRCGDIPAEIGCQHNIG